MNHMKTAIGLVLFFATVACAEQSMSVWDGIYMPRQADQGKAVFNEQCAVCHGDTLAGKNGPALTGPTFRENWNGLTADDLCEYIKDFDATPSGGTIEPGADPYDCRVSANVKWVPGGSERTSQRCQKPCRTFVLSLQNLGSNLQKPSDGKRFII
jgi:cytochrome c5